MQTKRRRAPGEGTFIERTRKLKNGSVVKEWVHVVSIGYDHSGRRVRRWISGKSKSELQFRVAKLRAENGGLISRRPIETTGEWIDKWLAGVKKSRAATTVRSYEERLRRYVIPNIGKVPLASLDAPKVAWLYETLEARGISADNISKVHKALRRSLNVAIGQGLIARNPTSHVARPAHRTKRRDAYDAAEVGRLLKAARGHRLEALFRLAIFGLLRPGELFALRWEDVDLERGRLDIRQTLRDDKGRLELAPAKADSARRIPIESGTIEALKRHKAAMKREGHLSPFVFVTEGGHWLRGNPVNAELKGVLAKAKLKPGTMYVLRHSGVSILGEAGVALRVAADLAGHSTTLLTSDVYSHAGEPLHREGVERAAKLVGKAARV